MGIFDPTVGTTLRSFCRQGINLMVATVLHRRAPGQYLFSVLGMARCAVRAAFSGATILPFVVGLSEGVPPATTRAETSQRDVPTTLNTHPPQRRAHHQMKTMSVCPRDCIC
jgi:hypothetical protein